ncbi:MAG: replication and repair protein RecF [Clostridiales bacterium]|jgi:DNA replication and repair protein RecF|nr:replication and repair protein RecF [Clostridiales bacterium]
MYVSNIKLRNYRNYSNADINFGKNINIIYGDNAQGKTNILESIYLFATGKSHRTNKDKELIKFDHEYANLKINFYNKNGLNSGEMILDQNQKKRIKINTVPINRLGELMGFLNAVLFAPEDLNLIKEGPSQRRRFLDIFISQLRPNYFYNLQQYIKVLEQRNNLLKTINLQKSSQSRHMLQDTLSIWDEKLVEHGSNIMLNRTVFIKKLKEYAKKIHLNITQEMEQLEVEYLPNVKMNHMEDLTAIKDLFQKRLNEKKKKELNTGVTLIGPHRDDIHFVVNNMPVKNYGSQGQQRTVIFSLKMAQMEFMKEDLGEYPVLLLDDIMSELDHNRQDYIIRNISDKQVFITCTDIDRFEKDHNTTFFRIENGTVFEGG